MWRRVVAAMAAIICIFCCSPHLPVAGSRDSKMSITVTTPSPDYGTSNSSVPNTFIAMVGQQITTKLLATSTPVLFWGAVSASDVETFCRRFVHTKKRSAQVSIKHSWGGWTDELNLLIVSVGGACASVGKEKGGGGSDILVLDSASGRKGAILCTPRTIAAVSRCGVYITGRDVERLYELSKRQGVREQQQQNANLGLSDDDRRRLADCTTGAENGMVQGVVTGTMAAQQCSVLGANLAPFCVDGVIGVAAIIGAIAGCLGDPRCFPSDATVRTRHIPALPISYLRIGDEIASWNPHSGTVDFQAVYAFGHRDASASATFVQISASPLHPHPATSTPAAIAALHLSPLHFVPTLSRSPSPQAQQRQLYKRAQDVVVGDVIWATVATDGGKNGGTVTPCVVQAVRLKTMQGLFNPLTMGGGTIIVDGVVASVHSEWFLDPIFEGMGLTHLLPHAYEFLLMPVRMLYTLLGRKRYAALYGWLDENVVDIATTGTRYGGAATASTLAAAVVTLVFLSRCCSSKSLKVGRTMSNPVLW